MDSSGVGGDETLKLPRYSPPIGDVLMGKEHHPPAPFAFVVVKIGLDLLPRSSRWQQASRMGGAKRALTHWARFR
ncbi:MAG TPA: hypothetical protein PKG54_11660 [Phycisphaerae bacterium]|jgi:hypothetical protein|nr:hypothetical protein [Phycisphaerae bacterium]HOB75171.1 hypothetical protein [Phycisphaerae bacterium]HOJ54607.1 hypothetical protein [Phycisphaerae bacterium]HOL28212.1 hypothetical protein [Phycisphaerae bacterium]HPP21033.1 hypothetical protein [Phycisphaerae bacterium]